MVVLVPSRNRPDNVARLLQSWSDTGSTAALVVLVDEDDPELLGYERLPIPTLHIGARRRIGPLLNDWAPLYADTYDVVGFMGDDHCPRTPGWDARILEASSPWSVVYGNDLLQGANIPTAVFMGSGLVRELGYFNPPGCQHLYLDNAWKYYGESLGTLRYLPDVIVEHLHYLAGKSPKDALYAEVNHTSMYDHDRAAFDAWRVGSASDDLARVRAAMNREEAPA
jgi:hypothetical protein